MYRTNGIMRSRPTPEQTAHNAKVKAARAAAAMTCQCCPGKILANTGVIAHHGYQRPGSGTQTSSCYGARHLPFEVDRSALGEVIEGLKNSIKHARAVRREIVAEANPILHMFTYYNQPRDAWGNRPTYCLQFTRENFEQQKADNADAIRRVCFFTTFDELKKNRLDEQDSKIKHLVADLKSCETKYASWSVTHEWVPGPAGVKLMPALAVDKGALGGWNKLPEGLMRLGANGRKP